MRSRARRTWSAPPKGRAGQRSPSSPLTARRRAPSRLPRTQKSTEVAAQDAQETQKSTEIAAEAAEKNTDTAAFPIEGYDEMNVGEVSERLDGLSVDELKRVRKYEKRNKDRGSLRKEMKQKIETTS
jgi:hypothetical protein